MFINETEGHKILKYKECYAHNMILDIDNDALRSMNTFIHLLNF